MMHVTVLLADVLPHDGASGHYQAAGETGNAPAHNADWRDVAEKGEADGMICGMISTTHRHLHFIHQVIGRRAGCPVYAAMNGLILPGRQVFLVDTHVNIDPTPEQLAEITRMAAAEMRRFGIEPKVALLSHSSFGSSAAPCAQKMREVLAIVRARAPELAI